MDKSRGEQLLEVSNAIAALKSECYGKGPAKTKTYEVDNLVFVVMQGGFTDAEHTLIAHGQHPIVREFRITFEEVTRPQMIDIVERALETRVVDYISQVLVFADVQIEIYVLEPGQRERTATQAVE
jgi:uncharacterized protein YbcI